MIDLDVRLDSSLTEDELRFLAREQGIDVSTFPETIFYNFSNAKKEDYESVRKFSLSLLQKEEAIEFAFASLIHRYFNEGYVYLEIALNPFLHKEEGLNQRKVLKAALRGLNDALEKCPGIDANIILYCDRNAPSEYNLDTTRLAIEYKDERVVAVGLEGEDKEHPMAEYEKLFARCKKINYPVVISLDKSYNSTNSILKAIQIGAHRIISPYRLEVTQEVFQILLERHVFFEFRPSMDLVYGFYPKLEEFPIKNLWRIGHHAFIASGADTLLRASLKNEFIHLGQHNGFTRDDVYHSLYMSTQAAFTRSIHEKDRMIRKLSKYFEEFYLKTI